MTRPNLEVKDDLFNDKDEEEAGDHNEGNHRQICCCPIFCFHIFQNLEAIEPKLVTTVVRLMWLQPVISTKYNRCKKYLFEDLIHTRDKIKKAGSHKNSTRETG